MMKQKKMCIFLVCSMDVVILLSAVVLNMCSSHANLIVYCWRTERQYIKIWPCIPSNRQPTSCDLVVTYDFNEQSGGIRAILCYHVWSLEKRIFWERILYSLKIRPLRVHPHTCTIYDIMLYCAAYSSCSILLLGV